MNDHCKENIKHLISRPETPMVKPLMYRSIYTDSVRRAYNSNKACHQTMGFAEVQLDPPEKFLRKHTRIVKNPSIGNILNTANINKKQICYKNIFILIYYFDIKDYDIFL